MRCFHGQRPKKGSNDDWQHPHDRDARINILKRMLIHVWAFNLSLIMRRSFGYGTPRGLASALSRLLVCGRHHLQRICHHLRRMIQILISTRSAQPSLTGTALAGRCFATGC